MRRIALSAGVLILAACAKKEETPPAPPPAAAAAPINLSTVAGMWTFKTMGATSDSVLVTYTVTATADTSGWIMNLPNRPAMTLHVTVAGDSIMVDSPKYESVLQKGVQVSTNGVLHLVGDKLIGTTKAHYSVTGPDSVKVLRTEGTKMPM